MKLFKKNEGKKTEKLPMSGKVRKGFRFYCTAVMALSLVVGTSVTAFAAVSYTHLDVYKRQAPNRRRKK